MDSHILTEFTKHIIGEVVMSGGHAYDGLRNVFNRTGSPALIVRARNNEDIMATIRLAREHQLPLSVRSGGHGLAGKATNDDGLVLDLAHFNQVELLDVESHLVRVGTGAHWGEVAKELALRGLAISSGDTNQVGVGGLTLGGGIGWLVRTHGLTIDSLHAAEVISADGRVLRASAEEHPDLFWAIRGGGGNFGVVTSFDFYAQPLQTVVGGSVSYDVAETESVLAAWTSAVREAPEELNSTIVLLPSFGPQVPPRLTVLLCYAGDDEAAANAAIKPFLHLGTMQTLDIQKKPYAAMLEDAVSPPPGLRLMGYNGFLKTLNREVLAAIAANYGKPGTPILQIRALGGAVARVDSQATAFAHRENEALAVMAAFGPANASEEQAQQIRQNAWRPLASLSSGAFINFVSDASEATVATVYPDATYTRLASIKAAYDPSNVFNQNQNIKPATNLL